MKKLTVLIFILIIGLSASAHPGKLDSNGGHYVRTPGHGYPVGSYHYHNGNSVTESVTEEPPEEPPALQKSPTTMNKQISIAIIAGLDILEILQNNVFTRFFEITNPPPPLNGPVIKSLPVVRTGDGDLKLNSTPAEIRAFVKNANKTRRWSEYQKRIKQQVYVVSSASTSQEHTWEFWDVKAIVILLSLLFFVVFIIILCRKISSLKNHLSTCEKKNAELNNKINSLNEEKKMLESIIANNNMRAQQSVPDEPTRRAIALLNEEVERLSVDNGRLSTKNNEFSKTNARLNLEISDLKQKLEQELSTKKIYEEILHERNKLRTEIIKPKNTKLKCTYTAQFDVSVKGAGGHFQKRPADIFVVNYSLFTFNETGYCMKETQQCQYFLERFYWPNGGYISFEPSAQLIPDGRTHVFTGTNDKAYEISFSADFRHASSDAELLQINTKKNMLSKLLADSKKLNERLGEVYNKIYSSVSESGVDLPLQAECIKAIKAFEEDYAALHKQFKTFTKDSNEKFKSKSEKNKH